MGAKTSKQLPHREQRNIESSQCIIPPIFEADYYAAVNARYAQQATNIDTQMQSGRVSFIYLEQARNRWKE